MPKYLLGIDIGTTGTKSLLVSENGDQIALDYQGYNLTTPQVGWNEQDAEDWWRAVVKTVRTICAENHIAKNVTAISLSTQGGTMVPVDQNYHPLRPAIVWSDKRCIEESKSLSEKLGKNYIYEKTGWKLSYGLNALQIAWIRQHEPEVFKKTSLFLSVPDYIALKMTGNAIVDISNAGINQLADIRRGAYDEKLMDFAGVKQEQLPSIVHSGQIIGKLTQEAAKTLGLQESTLLVAGSHDQYAVALGAGIIKEGDALIGSGTAWVLTALSEAPSFESGISQSISAVPNKWGSICSIKTGGVCLEWFRRNLISSNTEGSPLTLKAIDGYASKKPLGANGLFFYPYFNGSSFPHNDNSSKASILGLDLSHDQFDIARAIMEGVAFQIACALEAFRDYFPVVSLRLAGGASKSTLWSQIVADITNTPIRIPDMPDLACIGAAILAGVGSGVFDSIETGCRILSVSEHVINPNLEAAEKYAKLLKEYKQKGEALRSLYNC